MRRAVIVHGNPLGPGVGALAVFCPRCNAPAGSRCVRVPIRGQTLLYDHPMKGVHQERRGPHRASPGIKRLR